MTLILLHSKYICLRCWSLEEVTCPSRKCLFNSWKWVLLSYMSNCISITIFLANLGLVISLGYGPFSSSLTKILTFPMSSILPSPYVFQVDCSQKDILPFSLSHYLLNVVAVSHLQPCWHVPCKCFVFLSMPLHVTCNIWCVHLDICKWDCLAAAVRHCAQYNLLLSWLPALASWAGSKVPSKQNCCPFPWVSS